MRHPGPRPSKKSLSCHFPLCEPATCTSAPFASDNYNRTCCRTSSNPPCSPKQPWLTADLRSSGRSFLSLIPSTPGRSEYRPLCGFDSLIPRTKVSRAPPRPTAISGSSPVDYLLSLDLSRDCVWAVASVSRATQQRKSRRECNPTTLRCRGCAHSHHTFTGLAGRIVHDKVAANTS